MGNIYCDILVSPDTWHVNKWGESCPPTCLVSKSSTKLPEQELICACGCRKHAIGEETSEEIVPMQIRMIKHLWKVYACRGGESAPVTVDEPAQLIEKEHGQPQRDGDVGLSHRVRTFSGSTRLVSEKHSSGCCAGGPDDIFL
jgi:hypothetical protein